MSLAPAPSAFRRTIDPPPFALMVVAAAWSEDAGGT